MSPEKEEIREKGGNVMDFPGGTSISDASCKL